MDFDDAQRRIGRHAPREDSWLILPVPLATPLSALGREPLYVLKLAHNVGRVGTILAQSQLPEEDTFAHLVALIESRYLFQAFISLLFHEGPHAGRRDRFLPGNSVTLGRHESNDIRLADHRVSRHHARLTQTGDALVLTDLQSRNGVLHNGLRVKGEVQLMDGDRLVIGESVIEISLDYVGYDPDNVNTMELLRLDLDIDLDFDDDDALIISVDPMIEDAREVRADALDGVDLDAEALDVRYAIPVPLSEPLDLLTHHQLDVLQLAHNFNRLEAVLLNVEPDAREATVKALTLLEATGYLERV